MPRSKHAGEKPVNRAHKRIQIKHESLLWLYRNMRERIFECASMLGSYTNFIDHFIEDFHARLSVRILRNSAILDDKVSMQSPARERILALSFESIYIHRAKCAPRQFTPRGKELPFVEGVYDILIDSFMRATDGYTDLVMQSIALEIKISDTEVPEPADLVTMSQLRQQIQQIERRVGCRDSAKFYGIVVAVKSKMREVQEAQSLLMSAYERLISQLSRRFGRSHMQVDDNFQQGYYGLFRAARYFEPGKGKAFSGIARWWIRAAILLTIKKDCNMVAVPSTVWRQYENMEQLAHRHGVSGDIGEIARLSGKSVHEVEEVYAAVSINRPSSIEDKNSTDDGRLGDRLVDSRPSPVDLLVEHEDTFVKTLLGSKMDTTEWLILCLHFGMLERIPQQINESRVVEEMLRQYVAITAME